MNKKTRILNRQNNQLDKMIKDENQEVFTDLICYLRGSDLSEYNIEVVRNDLTEMVLSAQERGEGIEQVVGGDYKEFCDSIIETFPKKSFFEKLMDAIDTLIFCGAILMSVYTVLNKDFIKMIQDLIQNKKSDFLISYSQGSMVSLVVIILFAVFLVNFVISNSLKKQPLKEKIIISVSCVLYSGVLLVSLLLKNTLFVANAFVMLAIIVGMFVAHILLGLR